MNLFFFNSYLSFQKEHESSIRKKLFQLPFPWIVLFLLVLVSMILGVWFFIKGSIVGILFAIVFEFIFCEIANYYIDSFNIKTGDDALVQHWEYCKEFKQWLKEKGVSSSDSILEILRRTEKQVGNLKAERKLVYQRLEKWIQTLVIPITLAVITNVMNKQNDLSQTATNITSIIFIFLLLYFLIRMIWNIQLYSQKREIERMNCFLFDLQGVLDLETFNINI